VEDVQLRSRNKGFRVHEERDGNQVRETVTQFKQRDIRRTLKRALHYTEMMDCRRLPWNHRIACQWRAGRTPPWRRKCPGPP